jgi:hypothetical protein
MILWLIPLALQLWCDFSGVYEPNHRPLSRGGRIHGRLGRWLLAFRLRFRDFRTELGREFPALFSSPVPFISLLLRNERDSVYNLKDRQQSARPVTAVIPPVFCVGGHTGLVDEIYI